MSSRTSFGISTPSPAATEALGESLGKYLERSDVIYLVGDLGAGKTCLVRGLARGLESADRVTSPTFVLLNQYRGRQRLFHVDLYRTAGEGIDELGLWDHAEAGVLVIEWPDLAESGLPAPSLTIRMDHSASPEIRDITFTAHDARGAAILTGAGLA